MNILVACEESQAVTTELRKLGHRAFSCDIQECSGGHPEWHVMQDVLPLLNGNCTFVTADTHTHTQTGQWDLLIAFPPCTHLAVSGARHFESKRADGRQQEAIEFFCQFLNADCPRIAIENPVGIIGGTYIKEHFPSLASKYGLPIKPTQKIQPYQFGHQTRKTTCLWLKGLPKLVPTKIVDPILSSFTKKDGSTATFGTGFDMSRDEEGKIIAWNDPRTAKLRSKTFAGVAQAMAEQWAGNCTEQKGTSMELKINAMAIPEPITFNYEELKAELLQKVSIYESMVYTDDQIKVAKKDRASLNSLKKALNDERLRREREYMQPFNIFKSQIQEIIQIIDKPCAVIDKQIKAFEDLQKQEKLEAITSYWNESNHPAEVAFDQIFDGRWLNASVTMKTIQDAIDAKVAQITADIAVIDDLPAFSLEAKATYLQTLDLGKAVAQSHRLTELAEQQKAREAELEARKAQEESKPVQVEEVPEAPAEAPAKAKEQERKWIPFQCYLSAEEAKALGSFLKANGIQYKKI